MPNIEETPGPPFSHNVTGLVSGLLRDSKNQKNNAEPCSISIYPENFIIRKNVNMIKKKFFLKKRYGFRRDSLVLHLDRINCLKRLLKKLMMYDGYFMLIRTKFAII